MKLNAEFVNVQELYQGMHMVNYAINAWGLYNYFMSYSMLYIWSTIINFMLM